MGAPPDLVNFAELDRAAAEDGGRVTSDGVCVAHEAGLEAEPIAVKTTGLLGGRPRGGRSIVQRWSSIVRATRPRPDRSSKPAKGRSPAGKDRPAADAKYKRPPHGAGGVTRQARSLMALPTTHKRASTHEPIPSSNGGNAGARRADWSDPRFQAFALMRLAFTVAPIAFGLDKFFNLMVDWPTYLAPWINDIAPGSGQDFMYLVGAIEIVAGLAVAFKPRYGAYVVAAWLAGIVINLLTHSGFYDIALRDFGLMLAALTLARLASVYDPPLQLRRH